MSPLGKHLLSFIPLTKPPLHSHPRAYNILNELIIQKRKLELELHRNQQIKVKADNEKELLSGKVSKLQENINSYSNISMLKSQVEGKLENAKKEADKLKGNLAQLMLQKESLSSEMRDIRLEVDRNGSVGEAKALEQRLRDLLRVNETLKSSDSSQMMEELKNVVLEKAKAYNQTLLGF